MGIINVNKVDMGRADISVADMSRTNKKLI